MKTFKGIPEKINVPELGRVIKEHKLFQSKKDKILVGAFSTSYRGYKATISSIEFKDKKFSGIYDVQESEEIEKDDIILIEPDGTIKRLYSSSSVHNSIFLTELCNSNCVFCPQPPTKKETDKTELNLKIIELINEEPESIGITGGEPTILGDNFFKVLTSIQKKFPKTKIYILSNAIKFSNIEFTKKFIDHCNENVIVETPVYSDFPKLHNQIVGNNSYYKTLSGIYNLAKFNAKIGIRNVVSKLNYKRLDDYSNFIYRNFPFAHQVAFMQMELEGNAKMNFDQVFIDPYDYINELRLAVEVLELRGLNVLIYNFQLCLLDEYLRNFAVKSITEWKNIFLPICKDCSLRNQCPGFFKSIIDHPSRMISPINV